MNSQKVFRKSWHKVSKKNSQEVFKNNSEKVSEKKQKAL